MQHAELFDRVRRRLGMYVHEETFSAAAAFIQGYDAACEGGVLIGFREWLVMRTGRGANLSWPPLVLDVAFPGKGAAQTKLNRGGEAAQRHAIDTMFALIAEFDEVRRKHDGVRGVFREFERWASVASSDES